MAVRGAHAVIAKFSRVGVLCLDAAARTCIAHGLPEAPDSFTFTPLVGGSNTASIVPQTWWVESWDASLIVFVNSVTGVVVRGYVNLQQIHSIAE